MRITEPQVLVAVLQIAWVTQMPGVLVALPVAAAALPAPWRRDAAREGQRA